MSNKPAERFHPGVFVRAEMEARGWSMETMVEKCGIARYSLEEILAGSRSVGPVYAMLLGKAFGTSSEFWRNLQCSFDGKDEA